MSTNVHARHRTLHPGLAIAPRDTAAQYGTLGCIIRTSGRAMPFIAAGHYFLTNYHVITYAVPNGPYQGSGIILQPECDSQGAVPTDYNCGQYVYGVQDAENDCALCTVGYGRNAENKFPRRDWKTNHSRVRGMRSARAGDIVFKFGATTGFTKGIVLAVEKYFTEGKKVFQRTMQIRGLDGAAFCAPGDSGSLIVRKSDDMAVGLLFLEDTQSTIGNNGHCRDGYAYDLLSQMNNFCNSNGTVSLA